MLAISTSTTLWSVCSVDQDGAPHHVRMDGGRGTGQRASLTQMVWDALGKARLQPSQLRCIVCDVGPGSFTGLRQGLAVARAMAWAHGTLCVGVTSLEAMRAGLGTGHDLMTAAMVLPARTGVDFLGYGRADAWRDGTWVARTLTDAEAAPWWEAHPVQVLGVPPTDVGRPLARLAAARGARVIPVFPDAETMLLLATTRASAPAEQALVPRYLAVSEAEANAGIALPDLPTAAHSGAA